MKRLLQIVALLVVVAAGALAFLLHWRPSADGYGVAALPPSSDANGLQVTFLGVSTLLLRDPTAAVLIDGFFTRPGVLATAAGTITPDRERIFDGLALGRIDELDAVIAVHSHYDHAMDAPEVADHTGAVIVGSPSTAMIARGWNFPEDRIRIVRGTHSFDFGDLHITLIPSKHFPHGIAMGEITQPLHPPAKAADYLEGGSYSVLVERGGRSLLVQSSAGYLEGALDGRHADVAYLGVGLLGSKDEAYRDAYWRETVAAVGARRVIPIHWDDFTRGLDQPLVPLPYLLDDLDASMSFVKARAAREGVDLRWPVLGVPADPFAGL